MEQNKDVHQYVYALQWKKGYGLWSVVLSSGWGAILSSEVNSVSCNYTLDPGHETFRMRIMSTDFSYCAF